MAAETLHALHGDERFDLVVVDTPPNACLDFLGAPACCPGSSTIGSSSCDAPPARGGLRVIGTATQPILRAIGRVVGSDVLADSVAFFQAFVGMETGFAERADDVIALIRAPETSFVVVASVSSRGRHDHERGLGRSNQGNDVVGSLAESGLHAREGLEERHRVGEDVGADDPADRSQDRLRGGADHPQAAPGGQHQQLEEPMVEEPDNTPGASRKSRALRLGGVSTTTRSKRSSPCSAWSVSAAMYSCVPLSAPAMFR